MMFGVVHASVCSWPQGTVIADADQGKGRGTVNNVKAAEVEATPQMMRGTPDDNLYGMCPPPFSVWFPGKSRSRYGLSSA